MSSQILMHAPGCRVRSHSAASFVFKYPGLEEGANPPGHSIEGHRNTSTVGAGNDILGSAPPDPNIHKLAVPTSQNLAALDLSGINSSWSNDKSPDHQITPAAVQSHIKALIAVSEMPGQRKKNSTNGTNSNTTRSKDLTNYFKLSVARAFEAGTPASTEVEPFTPFLNLPVEIRTKIYQHALLSNLKKPYTVKPSNGAGCHFQCVIDGPKCKGTALFRVSRQISFEATSYFYNQLKIEVEDRPYCKNQSTYRLNSDNNAYHPSSLLDFKPFLLGIGEMNCASIRHLKINLTRMRTIERTYRRFSTPTTRYLTDALELLARSNNLRSLEINIDLQGGLDSFTANDVIMKQLHKFSGIQTVKITGQDHSRFITGPKKRATELEKDLKSSPGKIPKEALELFGKRKSDTSQAVLNGKRLALGITRKIEAINALEAQKKSLKDRLAVYETKCKNVRIAMEQTDDAIAQQETFLMETAPEDLARAQDMIADAEADEEVGE